MTAHGESGNGAVWVIIAGAAFTAWAGVVAWGVHEVTTQIADISARLQSHVGEQEKYTVETERRLTKLETNQRLVLDKLQIDGEKR